LPTSAKSDGPMPGNTIAVSAVLSVMSSHPAEMSE
jgi:hypothetical protein